MRESCPPSEWNWLTLPYEYRVDVGAEVDNLRLELVNVSDVSIKPGIATKIRGKYSDFKFAWDRILIPYDLYGTFALRIDWPSPFGASTITLAKAGLRELPSSTSTSTATAVRRRSSSTSPRRSGAATCRSQRRCRRAR